MGGVINNRVLPFSFGGPILTSHVATANASESYPWAYPWDGGFGAKVADPAAGTLGDVYSVVWSIDDDYVVHLENDGAATKQVGAYSWLGTGFGSRVAAPITGFSEFDRQLYFNKTGNCVSTGGSAITASPEVMRWDEGFGTRYAGPATPPPAEGRESRIDPSNRWILAPVWDVANTLNAWVWSVLSGFGTKFSDPTPRLTGVATSAAWFEDSTDYVVVGGLGTPNVAAYPWSSSGFGSPVANPATLPPGGVAGVGVSPDEEYVATNHLGSPFVTVYEFSSGFGTKVADPATLPNNVGYSIGWSRGQQGPLFLIQSSFTVPHINVWPWDGGFGAKVADPATLPCSAFGRQSSFSTGA